MERIEGRSKEGKTRNTRRESQRLKEEFHDTSFMAHRGMWHLNWKRVRDARKEGIEESENVVRECKAKAVEDFWSIWNQVKKQVHKFNHGDWSNPMRGIKREERRIRQDVTNIEAILGRWKDIEWNQKCQAEHRWITLIEDSKDFHWRKRNKRDRLKWKGMCE